MDINPYAPPKAAVADPLSGWYLWRITDLKRRLATAPLSDREALPYFVAYNALTGLALLLPPVQYNEWDWAGAVVTVAFAIFGPIWIYRRNGGSAGIHFLQRALALGWVMSLRIFAMGVLPLSLLYLTVAVTVGETPGTDWYDLLSIVGLQVVLYARVGSHIRDVAVGAPAAS